MCAHVQGGATALIAVSGGPSIASLDWLYIVLPAAFAAALLIAVGLLVNNTHPQRSYPQYWLRMPGSEGLAASCLRRCAPQPTGIDDAASELPPAFRAPADLQGSGERKESVQAESLAALRARVVAAARGTPRADGRQEGLVDAGSLVAGTRVWTPSEAHAAAVESLVSLHVLLQRGSNECSGTVAHDATDRASSWRESSDVHYLRAVIGAFADAFAADSAIAELGSGANGGRGAAGAESGASHADGAESSASWSATTKYSLAASPAVPRATLRAALPPSAPLPLEATSGAAFVKEVAPTHVAVAGNGTAAPRGVDAAASLSTSLPSASSAGSHTRKEKPLGRGRKRQDEDVAL